MTGIDGSPTEPCENCGTPVEFADELEPRGPWEVTVGRAPRMWLTPHTPERCREIRGRIRP